MLGPTTLPGAASPLPRGSDRAHTCLWTLQRREGGVIKIDETEFGSITIAGTTYKHDVVVRLSKKVVKRKKKLSKRLYGTSHTVSEDEVRFVFEKSCKELIFGTGQYGNAVLSPEAAAFLKKKAPSGTRAASGTSSVTKRSVSELQFDW